MFEIDVILISLFFIYFINFLLIKYNFLLDKKFYPHKSFTNSNLVPLSGGIIVTLTTLLFFQNKLIHVYLIYLIFLIGLLSDLNFLKSPLMRFILQVFTISLLIFFSKNFITSIRIPILDTLLNYQLFKYFFVIFCLLVLINGSNFIDGINTLLVGYYLIVIYFIILLIEKNNIVFEVENLNIFFSILLVLLVFNFFGKIFSGDSGSYLISLFVGYYLIKISSLDILISPYFIASLLWYPAYECLFSIIRKKIKKFDISKADNKHLHQLIFALLKKRFSFDTWIINSITGVSINFFNFLFIFFSFNFFSNTKVLVLGILIYTIFYNLVYFYLVKK